MRYLLCVYIGVVSVICSIIVSIVVIHIRGVEGVDRVALGGGFYCTIHYIHAHSVKCIVYSV
jgi:hypothetical protein